MKSIKWKLIAMYLGLVLIVMIVSGTFIVMSLQKIEVNKAESQLEQYAEKIKEQIVLSYDEARFQEGLSELLQGSPQMQSSILDQEGTTIASTVVNKPPYPQYKSSVIIRALNGEAAFKNGEKNADAYGPVREWMSYAAPVLVSTDVKYIVYTRIDASSIMNGLSQTKRTITISALLALGLTAVMGYIFAKTLTDPILVLTGKAKELAEGNLNQKMKVQSADEIGQLTQSFNHMAEELNKTMSVISKEKNKLEIILHNMTDGVISYDKSGQLIHVNSATLEMLALDEVPDTFSGFIKQFNIDTGVYFDMSPEFTKKMVFPVEKRFVNAAFSPYSNEKKELEGLVIVLQDITEQKKLDDMRKEFVANVSHELRTPLTTVKSYTETLLDGAMEDPEIATEFLQIIDSEADRMAFLVRDLLQLSRFDNKQVMFQYSDIDLNSFMEDMIQKSKIHAENKKQTLEFIPNKNAIAISADKDRIIQVVNNIITNAIKYSLQGAEIKAYITEDDTYAKVSIKDTGMGIAREDLPRIFERFYRVDKARSRAMGGTGLGLAIAKEIMEGHGGKITAESQYGKGTTMTLWFLKNRKFL